jgi:outer membrane immunogenic protein
MAAWVDDGGVAMKKFIYALAVLGALSFGAVDARADGSLKDAVPLAEAGRCVGGAFSGAYVGAQIGGGSLRSHQDIPATEESEGGAFSDDGAAFTIGTHSGYNVQCGRVLFGIESDFNYFDADTNSSQDYFCDGCSPETGTTSFKTSMNWFGTVRGRLGIVQMDNILIYATGGLACPSSGFSGRLRV